MPYLIRVIFLGLFTTLLGWSSAFAADDSGKDKSKTYPVYGDIKLVSNVRYQYAKPRIVIKLVYPTLTSGAEDDYITQFNQLITTIMQEEIDDFKKQVADNQTFQAKLPRSELKNDLTLDFNTSIININDNPLVSIRFNVQGYITGMAHPYHRHRVLNYALDYGKQVELADLFKADADYLNVLADFSRKALLKKLKDQAMVMEGTAPKPENYRNWNATPNGLLITFDEYQVAPYALGTQTVLIPYSALKEWIAPDSPIAVCLKSKRKCSRDKLLTGGFIATAIDTQHRRLNPILS